MMKRIRRNRYTAGLIVGGLIALSAAISHDQPLHQRQPEPCTSPYQGQTIPPEALTALLHKHETWLLNPDDPQGARLNACQANLQNAALEGANLRDAILRDADLRRANLRGANLSRAELHRANLQRADLQGANLNSAVLAQARLGDANLSQAYLNKTNLWQANLDQADLPNTFLLDANLQDASLVRTNLQDATVSGADLQGADLNGADLKRTIFEPEPGKLPAIADLALANHLAQLTFSASPHGLTELREALKGAGLRRQERDVTFALRRTERRRAAAIESAFNFMLFELTCQYGRLPGRALTIMLALMLVFSFPYTAALRRGNKRTGIWVTVTAYERQRRYLFKPWAPRLRVGTPLTPPKRFHLLQTSVFLMRMLWMTSRTWLRLLRIGLYFSLLSAFHLGWYSLDIRTWITNLQKRPYMLSGTGWVRTLTGVQALTSLYLWFIWALTYFGRPFE